jgi:UDP-2,3-diacylglucosamine pyrophosphatase LpxH
MHDSGRELFVISDLHVGGRYGVTASDRGFRINTHVDDLTRFVRGVAARSARQTTPTELIINGDFVDFLAQEGPADRPWRAFVEDPVEAVRVFDELVDQDREFFAALSAVIAAGVDLTLVLGNHDVELSLPAVRHRLSERLEAAGKGRLRFVYDGEAYVVGNVLIEHGNRYDGFNVIDHDRLRRLRSVQSRQQPPDDAARFEPPPGSRLVEQVINPIKRDYGFVDLLKPETEAVIPLLLALEPGFASRIETLWRIWRLKSEAERNAPVVPARPAHAGHIGAQQGSAGSQPSLRSLLAGHVDPARLERLLSLTEGVARETAAAAQRVGVREDLRRGWSLLRLNRGDLTWEERRRVLLDALRTLQTDRSFDPELEVSAYLDHATKLAASGFGVVLFGHTHLAKEVPLNGGARYINTGTWADLMKVPVELFDPVEANALSSLDRFVDALASNDLRRYLHFDPSFAHVRIEPDGKAASARLHRGGAAELSEL